MIVLSVPPMPGVSDMIIGQTESTVAIEAECLKVWRSLSPAMKQALDSSALCEGGRELVHPCSRETGLALRRRGLVATGWNMLSPVGVLVRHVGLRTA